MAFVPPVSIFGVKICVPTVVQLSLSTADALVRVSTGASRSICCDLFSIPSDTICAADLQLPGKHMLSFFRGPAVVTS